MNRVYNFSAGPSAMPLEVLERCAAEMVSYGTAGMSVMEMSHRSSSYQEIIDRTESLLREGLGSQQALSRTSPLSFTVILPSAVKV